jgi:predicted RNA-binding Zn-ribbon protein involved in translation (DUF1610 family)
MPTIPDDEPEENLDPTSLTSATCPQCGAKITFPGFVSVAVFVCPECGEPVQIEPPTQ